MAESPDTLISNDPFEDPAGSEASMDNDAVLTVDRNATLSLGTDSLIVLDEGLRHRRAARNLCGLLPQLSKTTRAVPFHNVLWADWNDFEVTVQYAQSQGRKACTVGRIHYQIVDKSSHAHAKSWVDKLMAKAYPPAAQRRKRIKVLVNPFGGQGYAETIWTRAVEPLFAAAHCDIDVEKTTYRGHATEIAQKLDIDAYDVVACASGDGLPHEVFNGLALHATPRQALRKIAVVQIPCGSGNALSLNMNGTDSPSLAALEIIKGVRTPLDLAVITQGDKKMYSFLSQAVGIIAETDLGTEPLRWMGSFRFTWGVIIRLLGKTIYPAEISVVTETDDKRVIREAYHRARANHEASQQKQLQQDETDGPATEETENKLPALKYGSVNDALHPEFVTQDMPRLGNFYVGNACWMSPDAPFFAAALPSDGKLDMILAQGDMPRTTAFSMLLTVENGTMMNFPEIDYRKVLAYRITPRRDALAPEKRFSARIWHWLGGGGQQTEGLIAIDGESIPFEPFQAEVVPSLGTVLSKHGPVYEFDGPVAP